MAYHEVPDSFANKEDGFLGLPEGIIFSSGSSQIG